MKKIISGLAAFAFLALIVFSCKKEKTDEGVKDITPTVANVSGSYTISKITLKNIPTGQEQEQTYPDCKKDDQLNFNADMTFNYVDAGIVCQYPGDWTGIWALPTSSTLETDGSPSTIIKFNGTELNLSAEFDENNSVITYLVKK
jgi:hypothetical protein